KGHVGVVERPLRCGSEPEVPVQTFGHWLRLFRPFDALRPERTTRPVPDLPHRSDSTVPNPFTELAGGFGCLIGYCNLSCDTRFFCNFGNPPRLVDGMGQRLLAKDVFAFLHRRSAYGRMQIVSGTHNDGVQIFLFLKQLAKIVIGGTAVIMAGALLRRVISIYDFLTW